MHTVRSVDTAQIFLNGQAAQEVPIIHWFSGSSEELQRAIKLGCWSLLAMSLKTKRGREYAKVYPKDKPLPRLTFPPVITQILDALDIVDSLNERLAVLARTVDFCAKWK